LHYLAYLLFERLPLSLGSELDLAVIFIAILIIIWAMAKDLFCCGCFFEMAGLSFVFTAVSFLIVLGLRAFIQVDI
jgi:hypothetical protein